MLWSSARELSGAGSPTVAGGATYGASTVGRRADDDPDKHILRLVVTVATMAGLLGVVEVHDLGRPGRCEWRCSCKGPGRGPGWPSSPCRRGPRAGPPQRAP